MFRDCLCSGLEFGNLLIALNALRQLHLVYENMLFYGPGTRSFIP